MKHIKPFLTYLLLPFLIGMLLWTRNMFFEYTINCLVGFMVFIISMMVLIIYTVGNRIEPEKLAEIKAKAFAKPWYQVVIAFLYSLALAMCLFVYVNNTVGILYGLCLLMLQMARLRLNTMKH